MSKALESLAALRSELQSSVRTDSVQADASPGLPAWLSALRDECFGLAEAQGIPTRRLEEWKGTSFGALEAMHFGRIGAGPDAGHAGTEPETADLVFVDGRCVSDSNEAPAGLRVLSLAEAIRTEPELLRAHLTRLADPKRSGLIALQSALFEEATIVVVEAGAHIERALHLRFVSTGGPDEAPSASFPRILVLAERGSQSALLLEHVSQGSANGLTALVAEFHLAEGARVETVQIQAESSERIHFTNTSAQVARDACFDSHVLTLGDGLVRSELSVVLAEPGADTHMRGFFLGRDAGHVDHFTTVDHAAAHCTSDEEYRGVLADRSKGVFRGRVIVRPDAQKTDARQSNPNLLLSNQASIDTKPQLEIYADDVRCSHGSTIGQLDPDALFFLRARGIDEAEARLLLTRAFATSIVDGIGNEAVRVSVAERVDGTLSLLQSASRSDANSDASGVSDGGESV